MKRIIKNEGLAWLQIVEKGVKQDGGNDNMLKVIKTCRVLMRRSMVYRVKALETMRLYGGLKELPGLALLEMLLLAHEKDYQFRYNRELNEFRQKVA
jgi:hypothetical protein